MSPAAPFDFSLFRVGGRLVINPGAFNTGSFPYGGTELGHIRDLAIAVEQHGEDISEEAFGQKVIVDRVITGESWGIVAMLEEPQWDNIAWIFRKEAGLVTTDPLVTFPATSTSDRPVGGFLGDSAVRLLFCPRDPDKQHLYFVRALPHVEAAARIRMSMGERAGIPVVFRATRPALGFTGTAKAVQWGFRTDIVT